MALPNGTYDPSASHADLPRSALLRRTRRHVHLALASRRSPFMDHLPVWLIVSFLLHRDTPKTLGWRADNLWPATRQGLWMFAGFIAAMLIAGISLGALHRTPRHVLDHHRFVGYFAFCLLQQIAVNSYLMNRFFVRYIHAGSCSIDRQSTPIRGTGPELRFIAHQEHPIIAAALSSLDLRRPPLAQPSADPRHPHRRLRHVPSVRPPAQHPPAHARPSHPRRPNLVGLPHRLAPLHARRPRLLLLRPPPR